MPASLQRKRTQPGARPMPRGSLAGLMKRRTPLAAISGWQRQLALLLRAGVPLVTALDSPALAEPAGWHADDVAALRRARAAIERGEGLSVALATHVAVLDLFSTKMLAAGELTGALERALERIAARNERRESLRRTVRQALIYPAIVLVVAVGALAALLVFVIPVFAEIFGELGEALPLPTRVVVACSEWLIAFLPLLVPGLVASAFAAVALLRNERFRRRVDAVMFAAPIIGPVVRAGAVADAMETLGNLVAGGIPLFDALPVAAQTAGNAVVRHDLDRAQRRIADGVPLATALAQSRLPPLAIQMIAVGEDTGALDQVLESVARVFREEADRQVALLMTLLEPAVLLLLAGGVGAVVVSMYLPIFRLGAAIG